MGCASWTYKGKYFFVIPSKEAEWTNSYFEPSTETINVISYTLKKGNSQFIYPTTWITKIYSIENNEFRFKSIQYDTNDSTDHLEK